MLRRPALLLSAAVLTSAAALGQGADDCANAQVITGLGPHPFDNTNAGPTPGLTDCAGLPVRKDVWFAWTATTTARVTVEICGQTTLETRIAVYDGLDCNNLVQLTCAASACPAPSLVRFQAIAGQSYLIRLGSRSLGTSGTGTFTLIESIPLQNPANGSYYEVIDENLSWPQARAAAEALDWLGRPGRLAVFRDQAEIDWVVNNVAPARPWIGLFQDTNHPQYSEPGGGWVWIDGRDLNFNNWAPGEPNNTSASAGAEDYAEMFGDGKWNDAEENHANTFQYLVEYADGSIGTNYCTPNANSTGTTGSASANGSATVADNDFNLVASDLPNNTFGFFITSRTQGFAANPGGSAGNLCLGGQIGRFQMQVQNTGGTGSITIQADLTGFPNPSGGPITVLPGDTWNFQAWHRDAVGGSATSNFTDGLEVDFN